MQTQCAPLASPQRERTRALIPSPAAVADDSLLVLNRFLFLRRQRMRERQYHCGGPDNPENMQPSVPFHVQTYPSFCREATSPLFLSIPFHPAQNGGPLRIPARRLRQSYVFYKHVQHSVLPVQCFKFFKRR